MVPYLPPDCYGQIFQYLARDRNSLHCCILVNRQWCKSAIPVLWQEPFRLLYTCCDPADFSPATWRIRAGQLIETYFLYLNANEKATLKKKNLYLVSSIEMSDHQSPCPIFNYAQLLKCVDLGEVYAAVIAWVEYSRDCSSLTTESRDHHQPSLFLRQMNRISVVSFLIQQFNDRRSKHKKNVAELTALHVFSEFLMRKCWTITTLTIDTIHHHAMPNVLLSLPTYPGASSCLSQLVELKCTSKSQKTKFFNEIAKVARNLRRLSVWMTYPRVNAQDIPLDRRRQHTKRLLSMNEESEALVKVIRAQKGLRALELGYFPVGFDTVISAVACQCSSLRRISFTRIDFQDAMPLEGLAFCNKLEKIKFNSCPNLSSRILQPLATADFPHLRKIDINSPAPVDSVEVLIRNSNNSIEKLSLTTLTTERDSETTPMVIQTIAQYCPNLLRLSVLPTKKELPQLITLINLCPKLETLIITGNRWPEIEFDSILRDMSKQRLPNLKHLGVQAALKMSPTTLDTFFSKTKAPIETLEFYQSQCFTEHHLDVVLNRLNKTLKDLRIQSFRMLRSSAVKKAKDRIQSVHVYPM